MSSWACETGGWTGRSVLDSLRCDLHHPLTLNLYADNGTATPGGVLASMTMNATIPYRPSADLVNCTGGRWFNGTTCFNGFAAPVTFNFPVGHGAAEPLHLGDLVQHDHHGYDPIGAAACGTQLPLRLAERRRRIADAEADERHGRRPVRRVPEQLRRRLLLRRWRRWRRCAAPRQRLLGEQPPDGDVSTRVLSQADSTVVVRASTPTWGSSRRTPSAPRRAATQPVHRCRHSEPAAPRSA